MEQASHIHIGTSGWSYKHWAGTFYPPGLKSAEYLTFYAKQFPVSEVNSSFYRLPTRNTVQKWIDSVPRDFLFCPKMSRYLTHLKKLHDPDEPLERFFGIFDPFAKHLGPILMQLPDSLKWNEEVVVPFYQLLKKRYSDYRFAIEVRHESWFAKERIDLMKKYGIALAIAQSEKYPYHEEITAKDIFIRFHGPKELYSSSYPENVLLNYAEKFVEWKRQGHTIWAFFNNDVNGHAFRNAALLKRLIDDIS